MGDSAMRRAPIGGINIANRLIMAPVLRSLGGQPDPVADPRRLFQPEGQALALRQRKQTFCAEQIDKSCGISSCVCCNRP